MGELDGRVAVITGAARGIGASIAEGLAAQGARVVVADLDRAGAEAAAARLPGSAVGFGVDIASYDAVAALIDRVEAEVGPIEILVNNAGIDVIGRFLDSDPADWDRILQVNLSGLFNLSHRAVAKMADRGRGRVINIGSDAGRVGSSGEVVYSATKGGVIAFTKALAREVASRGITVNCVCPGPTETALLGQVAEASPKLYDSLAKAIPLRRIGQPEDLAPAVAFLAGDGASFITGQTLSVSGGLTMA